MGNCDIQGTKIEERGFGYTFKILSGKSGIAVVMLARTCCGFAQS